MTKTKTQYYLDGAPLLLGKQIGRGGEGIVYLASSYPGTAIKIYTGPENAQREAKVSSMVKYKLAEKTSLVAFPKGIVKTKAGSFVGLAMNLVMGHRPLHEAYEPKSRKIHFPNADYRFLIRVAANVARAVGQVHQTTCVIGDINHSGILVSNDATVAIIDADSFQFEENGKHFPCLVGVPDFTPPELQGKSLNGVVRTKHHDYFGLAVAIFQLLFMGRHPYAGRHPDQNISLEQAIERNLFAYSRLRKTQMTPPASIVTLDDFPSDVANDFERAFGVDSLSRPNPAKWVEILTRLESQLNRCEVNPMHYYPSNGKSCPWCRMEYTSGAVLFIAPISMSSATYTIHPNMSIDKIWAEIKNISIPQVNYINSKLPASSIGSPSQDAQQSISSLQGVKLLSVVGVVAAVCAWAYAPTLFIIWLIGIIFCLSQFSNASINNSKWIDRYKKADNAFNDALVVWQQRSGVAKLYEIRFSLEGSANELRNLAVLESQAINQLKSDHRKNQLLNYLDQFLLSRATIPGIGSSKKIVLASFGIETAADINKSDIMEIPGFGEATATKLLAWREVHERKFVYNPKVSSMDIKTQAKIESEFKKKSDVLVNRITSSFMEFRQTLNQVQGRIASSDSRLNQLAIARAQVEVDLKFLGISKPACISKQPVSSVTGSKSTNNSYQGVSTSATNAMKCDRCGSVMVRRIARRGRNVGNSFWGCSRYPRCKSTKP